MRIRERDIIEANRRFTRRALLLGGAQMATAAGLGLRTHWMQV